MKVRLKFFSILKNRLGGSERELSLDRPVSIGDLFFRLIGNRTEAERMIRFIRFAVNNEYVPPDTLVHNGDEVAMIPPVSGG